MSQIFSCDDKETLVAYLYGEIDSELRREVERHLRTCAACAREAEGLHALRQDLALWLPPEPELGFTLVQKSMQSQSPPPATVVRPARWQRLATMPVWAQVAAAALALAAGAAIANLQVRYDQSGIVVTSGWMAPPAPALPVAAPAEDWRPALASLEQNLRSELVQMKRTGDSDLAAMRSADAAGETAVILRRVQAMLEASEQRQRQEMASRLALAARDWNIQRQGDLFKINQNLGMLQGRTFRTEEGQREVVNYVNYLRRVSGQPIP